MKQHNGFILVVALALLAAAQGIEAAGPTRVLHRPPQASTMGEAVPFAVTVEGVPDGEPSVRLFYRGRGSRDFRSLPLAARGEGLYDAALPATETAFLEMAYYIEIEGPGQAYQTAIGSQDAPMSLALREPAAAPQFSLLGRVIFPAGGIVVLAGAFLLRERRRKRRVLDQLFWAQLLIPLSHLNGQAFSNALTRLLKDPLQHPVLGPRRFTRPYLLNKIQEVRAMDLNRLLRNRDVYLGPDFSFPQNPALAAQGSEPMATQSPPARKRPAEAKDGLIQVVTTPSGSSRTPKHPSSQEYA